MLGFARGAMCKKYPVVVRHHLPTWVCGLSSMRLHHRHIPRVIQ